MISESDNFGRETFVLRLDISGFFMSIDRDILYSLIIMGLEKGFDTVVGGSGAHLSGGERQRICIARAMLKNAPVIILDEATAYTDPENEALVQSSVAKLVRGKTLIVIAHRLSTIVDADKIFVINKGELEACGTHEELLVKCPLYNKMWIAHSMAKDNADAVSAISEKEAFYA